MNNELETQDIGALHCVSVGWPDEHRFVYLPGDPSLDVDGGAPMLHLLRMGSADQLSLQMSWAPGPGVVDAARGQLQSQFPDEAVSLMPAELDAVQVTLVLVADSGATRELGPFAASGTSANRLAVVEPVSKEDAEAVQAAMAGAEGRFHVRYEGALRFVAHAELTLQGSLQPLYAALLPPAPKKPSGLFSFDKKGKPAKPAVPTTEQVRQAVEAALATGTLTLDVRRTEHFSEDALAQATEPLLATLVHQVLGNWSNATLAASSAPEDLPLRSTTRVPERREWHIEASADVGHAFARTADARPTPGRAGD